MDHNHDADCKCIPTAAVQSLDEMDFERGIWSAGKRLYYAIWLVYGEVHVYFPFFISALYNDLEKLDKFIRSGETNNVDSNGYTALHYASRNGHLTACELLLKAGAEVNACTRSGGVTPLIRAALMGNFSLYEQKKNRIILRKVCHSRFISLGHDNIVQQLLRSGADIFHQDNDGNTALHKAAQNQHHHVMELLLDSTTEKHRLEGICNKKGLTANDITK